MKTRSFACLLIFFLVSASSPPLAFGEGAESFNQAQEQAAARGVPILVDFFTDWCVYCKHFDADRAKAETGLADALAATVFVQIDAEKGEGIEIAKRYGVDGFPTYILMDAEGVVIDQWSGYGGPEHFLGVFRPAMADPLPLAQKRERFEANPTAADAQLFARVAMGSGEYDEALSLYAQAEQLDPTLDLVSEEFWAAYSSLRAGGSVDSDGLRQRADALLASPAADPGELGDVASVMTRISLKAEADFHLDYLKAAQARAADMEPADAAKLAVLVALHVDQDKARAAELKKATMPDGWMDRAGDLNGYAWWCFENGANLEEAEQLARRGVELAVPGKEKAMILDTVAEICNARGNCRDAVSLMELAIAEDPGNEGYHQQLDRFQKIVAASE